MYKRLITPAKNIVRNGSSCVRIKCRIKLKTELDEKAF